MDNIQSIAEERVLTQQGEAMDIEQQTIMVTKFDTGVLWREVERRIGDLIMYRESIKSIEDQFRNIE